MNVFPYRFYASDKYGWADCPELSKLLWNRLRPKAFTWYATDMEVLSPTSVRLFAYEMADNFSGGIGGQIYETVVTEFTKEEKVALDKAVLRIYNNAAEAELERREEAARLNKISTVRKELFGV